MARHSALLALAGCLALGVSASLGGKVFGVSAFHDKAATLDVKTGEYQFVGKVHLGSLVSQGLGELSKDKQTFYTFVNKDNLATNNMIGFSTQDGKLTDFDVIVPSRIEPYGGVGTYMGLDPTKGMLYLCVLPADFMNPNITMYTIDTKTQALTKVGAVGPIVPNANGRGLVSAVDYSKGLFWIQGYYNKLFTVDAQGNQKYEARVPSNLVSLHYYHAKSHLYALAHTSSGVELLSISSTGRSVQSLATFSSIKSIKNNAVALDSENGILYALAVTSSPDIALIGIDLHSHKIVSNLKSVCVSGASYTNPCMDALVYLG